MTANENTSRRQFGAYKPADVKPFDDSDFDYDSAPAVPANRADILKGFGVTVQEGNGEPLTGKPKLVGSEPAKYRPRPVKPAGHKSAQVEWTEPPKPEAAIREPKPVEKPTPAPVAESKTVAKPEAKPAPVTPPVTPTMPGAGTRPSRRPTPPPAQAAPAQPKVRQPKVQHNPEPVERRPPTPPAQPPRQPPASPPAAPEPPQRPQPQGTETRGGYTFSTRQTRKVHESDRAAKPAEHGTYEHPSLSFPNRETGESRERTEPVRNFQPPQPSQADTGIREAHRRISGLENEVSELRSHIESPSPKPRVKKGRRRMVARDGKWMDI